MGETKGNDLSGMILDNCSVFSRQSQNGDKALIHHFIAAEMQHW